MHEYNILSQSVMAVASLNLSSLEILISLSSVERLLITTHHDRIIEFEFSRTGVFFGGLPPQTFTFPLGVELFNIIRYNNRGSPPPPPPPSFYMFVVS